MAREYYDGRDHYILYAEETAFATGGTISTSNHMGRVQSLTVDANNNLIRSQGLGEGANAQNATLGNFDCSITVNTKPVDLNIFQYAVGERAAGTAGTSGDPHEVNELDQHGYTSTFIPTLKVEVGAKGITTNQAYTFVGVAMNSWELSGSVGEDLTATINMAAKAFSRGTSITTYVAPTDKTINFAGGSVLWDSGSDVLSLTNFSITCDFPSIYPRELFSDRLAKQPTKTVRRYDWTLTMNKHLDAGSNIMSSTELLDEFFLASNSPIDNGAITGKQLRIRIDEGSATGDRDIYIEFENSFINNWSENPTLEAGVTSITVTGFSLAGLTDSGSGENVPLRWFTN